MMVAGSLANTTARIYNGLYAVDLGVGQSTLTVTYDVKKELKAVKVPKTSDSDASVPQTALYDFNQITMTFTLEGYLVDDDTNTAKQKMMNLEKMFLTKPSVRQLNFQWSNAPAFFGTNRYTCGCSSYRFVESAGQPSAVKFTVVLLSYNTTL